MRVLGRVKSPIQPRGLKNPAQQALGGVDHYQTLITLIAELKKLQGEFELGIDSGNKKLDTKLAEIAMEIVSIKAKALETLKSIREETTAQTNRRLTQEIAKLIGEYERDAKSVKEKTVEIISKADSALEENKKTLKHILEIKKGDRGAQGENGKDGKNGINGKDGVSPNIETVVSKTLEKLFEKKIPMSHIQGLMGELAIYRSHQMLGGQMRGGGDTVSAGIGISIAYDSNGNKVITNTGTASNEVYGETPTGSGTAFTLANTPTAGTLRLYRGGIRLKETTDYTLAGANITLNTALETGEELTADYKYV